MLDCEGGSGGQGACHVQQRQAADDAVAPVVLRPEAVPYLHESWGPASLLCTALLTLVEGSRFQLEKTPIHDHGP